MKVAISSTKENLEGSVNDTFGRCPYFIIAEIEDARVIKFEALKNMSASQMGGAGISAAQAVVDKGVEAVITANLGPRAADVLRQFDVKVYEASGLAKDVLQQFIDGELKEIK